MCGLLPAATASQNYLFAPIFFIVILYVLISRRHPHFLFSSSSPVGTQAKPRAEIQFAPRAASCNSLKSSVPHHYELQLQMDLERDRDSEVLFCLDVVRRCGMARVTRGFSTMS
jgi:hypothetical protein